MRKIIFQMMISLDGYFEGPGRELDWHNVDEEFNAYAIEFLNSIGILLFGRVTYDLMASYWPGPSAIQDDPLVAERMNSLPKIVCSRTLNKADWNNTRLVKENIADEIFKLKQEPGKPIVIFGSSDLSVDLITNNLIDEFRIFISPIVLGEGKPLFKGIKHRYKLELVKTRTFKSGNILLYYKPADAG